MTHTPGDSSTNTSALISPIRPPEIAPLLVSPFQYIASSRIGKLDDAAMPKARATRNATFCPLKAIPRRTATTPRPTVAQRLTRISVFGHGVPLHKTLAYRSWEIADAPASAKPATTARMVAKATAARKPNMRSPPSACARCMMAMFTPPSSGPPITPCSKNCGCCPTMLIAAVPSTHTRMKNRPISP
ncbi:hypothetical protein D3C76_1143960 [compost metagenome]